MSCFKHDFLFWSLLSSQLLFLAECQNTAYLFLSTSGPFGGSVTQRVGSQPLQSRSFSHRYLFWLVGDLWKPPHPTPFPCWKLGWLGPASLCNFPNQAIRTKIFSLSDVRFSHCYTIISVTFLVYSATVTVTAFQGRQSENGHLHILILILIWWHASGVATSSSPTRCLDWFFFAKSFAKRTEVMKREDVGIS